MEIDDDVIARIAAREVIALGLKRLHEGCAVGGFPPACGDVRHRLFGFGDAGALLLLALAQIFLFRAVVVAVTPAVLCVTRLQAVRQFQPVVAGEVLRDRAQLPAGRARSARLSFDVAVSMRDQTAWQCSRSTPCSSRFS